MTPHRLALRLAVALALTAALVIAAAPPALARSAPPLEDAIARTAQVAGYASSGSVTVRNSPKSWLEGLPEADPTRELTLIAFTGQHQPGASQVLLSGLYAEAWGGNPEVGLPAIISEGVTYLRGPLSLTGADERRWYRYDDTLGWGYDAQSVVAWLSEADLGRATQQGDERLGGQQCAVYALDDHSAAVRSMLALTDYGVDEEMTDTLADRVVRAETRVWVCGDGYVHQVVSTYDLDCGCPTSDPQALIRPEGDVRVSYRPVSSGRHIATYRVRVRLSGFGAPLQITPPAEAQPFNMATALMGDQGSSVGTVRNGGNIRAEPSRRGEVVGQVHAGETVALEAKTADGVWYFVVAAEGYGWVHGSLLAVDPAVAEQIEVVP